MPTYDYCCPACGGEFEAFKSIAESETAACPKCGKAARKIPSAISFSIHGTAASRRAADFRKSERDYENEIKSRMGVAKVQRLNGSTMREVYHDTMAQEGRIREQMAETAEKSAKARAEKNRIWRREALKRTEKRGKEMAERKAAEAYRKRAVRI